MSKDSLTVPEKFYGGRYEELKPRIEYLAILKNSRYGKIMKFYPYNSTLFLLPVHKILPVPVVVDDDGILKVLPPIFG